MNKHKLMVLGLSAVLFASSCKKNDMESSIAQASAAKAVQTSEWKSISKWSTQSQENYAVYSSNLQDSSISSSVASQGLVLAYKKNGSTVSALPYEEKAGAGSYFWYYQVSQGGIAIMADAYGGATTPASSLGFKYFVISADKLSQLESAGHSKAELMKLSYDEASALLK
jgi:hypothetical protein